MSYYNTTPIKNQLLIEFSQIAESQEALILSFFQERSGLSFTWSDVQEVFPNIPEISIKRSMTDLKNAGKLIKTSMIELSKYKRPAHKYTTV